MAAWGMTRRTFLRAAAALGLGVTIGRGSPHYLATFRAPNALWPTEPAALRPVEKLPRRSRVWVGPSFWANRLQDWHLRDGWIECLSGVGHHGLRSVSLLSRDLDDSTKPAFINVSLRRIEGDDGFAGLLVGTGAGNLDWRAAALCHSASGMGGGLLCTYETDGRVRIREHTDENNSFIYAELPVGRPIPNPAPPVQEVVLRVAVIPGAGSSEIRVSAVEPVTDRVLDAATHHVQPEEVEGGIALVSCARRDGTRYAFRAPATAGPGIAVRSKRRFGPVLGTMYSMDTSKGPRDAVLKLTVQIAPVGSDDPKLVRFEFRRPGQAEWEHVRPRSIGDGYTAVFRIPGWDARHKWQYRVLYGASTYKGLIPADPRQGRNLRIAIIGCLAPVGRRFDDASRFVPQMGERYPGRYTPSNVYFPHTEIVEAVRKRNPDLLVFNGDQIYEFLPTLDDPSESPRMDYLYKWFLFVWSFRSLTANIPTVVQVDDHDVYHSNLWGEGGEPQTVSGAGGYRKDPSWVNLVQRVQCAHNPAPYDRAPVNQGISVYYSTFFYGGVSFALLEDRKWKTGPGSDGQIPAGGDLLGPRQEAFLDAWRNLHNDAPKVALSQTLLASLQTTRSGTPARDSDSNGVPAPARDRACRLLKRAGAFVVSGDQHLPALVKHGIDSHSDGPVQFSVPAGANYHLRWFEPGQTLANGRDGLRFTGDWTDGYGNKLRSLAVANPRVSQSEFRSSYPQGAQMYDRQLRGNDGFGELIIDKEKRTYIVHCWAFDTERSASSQFAGWPYEVPF